MKLIREHINEKFEQESDPVWDMGIGKKYYIEKWIDYYSIKVPIDRNHDFKDKCIINDDLTIDVRGSMSLNSVGLFKLPRYIKFKNVYGDFMINHNNLENLVGCPDFIEANFYINGNPIKSLEGFPKKVGHQVAMSKIVKISEKQLRKACQFTTIYYTDESYEKIYNVKSDYYLGKRIGKIEDYVFDL
jgi:hypothetical protein